MPTPNTTEARVLDVPGARLYYELRGAGPLLLIIGAPMASVFFAGLADVFAADHTVLTYDPRGISRSTLTAPAGDDTAVTRAEDVRRLIEATGGGPADVFGSSGGAMTGLALVERHPDLVRTLVAHEPPLVDLLPDAEEHIADGKELYRVWKEEGPDAAFAKFLGGAGFDEGPDMSAFSIRAEEARADNDYFFGHMIGATARYLPDAASLRAAASTTRIVIGAGSTAPEQLTYRTSVATAELLGTPVVHFPGDHGGFLTHPTEFAARLREVLAGEPSR